MPEYLAKKFHQETNNNFSPEKTSLDPKFWPEEWKKIHYKTYPRFAKIKLSENLLELGSLENSLSKRISKREFDIDKPITFDELSTLAHYSSGIQKKILEDEKERRFYPSGGSRYPLELYFIIQRVENMKSGIYHFNVKDKLFEIMTSNTGYLENFSQSLSSPWSQETALAIVITSVWDRNFIKYKDFGYRIVLAEAGHLSQNLALIASSLKIGCCHIMGFNNKKVDEILDIQDENESSLYITLFGK